MPELANPQERPSPVPRRILIVDDADEARAILAIALGTIAGVKVDIAESGEDALAWVEGATVDVLVTDIRMGGMNGLELLTRLRQEKKWPRCGALVISGETDGSLAQRALECGAARFFTKPFSASEVRRSVISLLESFYGMA